MKRILSLICMLAMITAFVFSSEAEAITIPELSADLKVRIGLRYGDDALTSANLQNTVGYGSGYAAGYYDSNDNFVPLQYIGDTEITISASGSTYTITNTVSGAKIASITSDGWTLAVVPQSTDGTKTRTWFKNNIYYGAFEYDRNSNGTLNVINVVNIEDYIKGILPYEMSPKWPLEALKAQAIAARTFAVYTLDKHKVYGFDLCNTTDCQVYYGIKNANETTDLAVDETRGMYATYNNKPINAVYHSSNGGATENSENIWNEALPYLRAVKDEFEAQTNMTNKSWSFEITLSELTEILKQRGNDISQIVHAYAEYTKAGNVAKLVFIDANGKKLEYEKERARSVLKNSTYGINVISQRFIFEDKANPRVTSVDDFISPVSRAAYIDQSIVSSSEAPIFADPFTKSVLTTQGLISLQAGYGMTGRFKILSSSGLSETDSVFAVGGAGITGAASSGVIDGTTLAAPSSSSGTFIIRGSGYGHNVGMSQYGAKAMAELGYSCFDIINYYYTDVNIITVY